MNLTAASCSLPTTPQAPRALRLLVVDGHCLFRQALRALLAGHERFNVVGEAAGASEALGLAAALQPDAVLTDLHLPDGNGLELIAELQQSAPGVRVLVVTALGARGVPTAVRRAGAAGYLLKERGRAELWRALYELAAGRWYCSEGTATKRRQSQFDGGDARGAQAVHLTDRQRQVLRSVALGQSTRDIARTLGVSVRAIYRQRACLRNALQLDGTAALTRFAVREGLVPESAALP